jgi:predicted metal-binding protein
MKEMLVEKLVKHYRTSGCDRYGQLNTISARQIAKTDEEMEVLKEIVQVALVGYQYGTYEGIFPWGKFKDKDVEQMCKEAFAQNSSRNNGNHW